MSTPTTPWRRISEELILGEELVSQMLVAISAGIVMLCDDIKWENLSKNYLAAKVALG